MSFCGIYLMYDAFFNYKDMQSRPVQLWEIILVFLLLVYFFYKFSFFINLVFF